MQGNWQKESPLTEELELVKRSNDLSFGALFMRSPYYAGRSGNLGRLQGIIFRKMAGSVHEGMLREGGI